MVYDRPRSTEQCGQRISSRAECATAFEGRICYIRSDILGCNIVEHSYYTSVTMGGFIRSLAAYLRGQTRMFNDLTNIFRRIASHITASEIQVGYRSDHIMNNKRRAGGRLVDFEIYDENRVTFPEPTSADQRNTCTTSAPVTHQDIDSWTSKTLRAALGQPVASQGHLASSPPPSWIASSIERNTEIEPIISPFTTTIVPEKPELWEDPTHLCGIVIDSTQTPARVLLINVFQNSTSNQHSSSPQREARAAQMRSYSFPQTIFGNEDTRLDEYAQKSENVLVARMKKITRHDVQPLLARYITHHDVATREPRAWTTTGAIQTRFDDEPGKAKVVISYYACLAQECSLAIVENSGEASRPVWVDVDAYDQDMEVQEENPTIAFRRRMLWWAVEHLLCSSVLEEGRLGGYRRVHQLLRQRYTSGLRQ